MPAFLDLHGKTNKVLRALSEQAMRPLGLHLGQNLLLAVLWERDGSTPGEIAAAVNVATPTVVKMATRMAAAGLLVRRGDATDNRLVRLWLTRAGRALEKPVADARASLEEHVTADLGEAERKHLMSALDKIYRSASGLLASDVSRRGGRASATSAEPRRRSRRPRRGA